jgi:cob(I)alamin adenosyltransferase
MKIYTKAGDKGMTSIYGGKPLSKDDIRIESYGTVDELNSWLGILVSNSEDEKEKQLLLKIQSELFSIGSILASTADKHESMPQVNQNDVEALESAIDFMQTALPPLKSFILPGGNHRSSFCHLSRTVCRRAERRIVSFSNVEQVPDLIIVYMNRLSDYLFVLSRYWSMKDGLEDIPWIPKQK